MTNYGGSAVTIWCNRFNTAFEWNTEAVPEHCDECTCTFMGHRCKDVIKAGLKPKWVQLEFNFGGTNG